MSAGLKTPKRRELLVSNTTFMNFDSSMCTAISTCSGCSRGQGKLNGCRFAKSLTSLHYRVGLMNDECGYASLATALRVLMEGWSPLRAAGSPFAICLQVPTSQISQISYLIFGQATNSQICK